MSTPTNSSIPLRGHRPRSSSLSLSIARSPSVLSSGLFFPPPQPHSNTNDVESLIENEILHHPNVYNTHPYSSGGNPIRRVISAGGVLDPIPGSDEDDLIQDEARDKLGASSSTPQLSNFQQDDTITSTRHYPTRSNIGNNHGNHNREDNEDDDEDIVVEDGTNYVNKPLLSRKVTFPPDLPHTPSNALSRTSTRNTNTSNDIEMEMDESDIRYEGPFQPPDSKELLSIILSVFGVLVLAVAAGFTTIFDWVL